MKAELLTVAKHGAEVAPEVMAGPYGEWVTVLMYETAEGVIRTAGLSPELLRDENMMLAQEMIGNVLKGNAAVQAAFITPIWVASVEPGDEHKVRARDHPNREERVMVTYVTQDSTRVETARVVRSDTEKPRLGSWDHVYEGLEVGGGFADVMRAAIL